MDWKRVEIDWKREDMNWKREDMNWKREDMNWKREDMNWKWVDIGLEVGGHRIGSGWTSDWKRLDTELEMGRIALEVEVERNSHLNQVNQYGNRSGLNGQELNEKCFILYMYLH